MRQTIGRTALALVVPALVAAGADTTILQLQIVEGDGAVFAAGRRTVKPVTVRVSNETGAPVAGATVSFRLPEESVTGVFQNGLRTDMVLSGTDGRAVSPNIQWGPLGGPARLRVTAARGSARAGLLVSVYISAENVVTAGAEAAPSPSPVAVAPLAPVEREPTPKLKKKRPWVPWAVAAAGGLGAGAYFAFNKRPSSGGGGLAGPAISIGQPIISVGRIP